MFDFQPSLPIDPVLPTICDELRKYKRLVLQAPPGAGKTTRVPLALHIAGLFDGRIIMLEPRRLAARTAAERLAQHFGEDIGGTVGLRMRGDSKISSNTRIEVVTEGVLTRMMQSDQALEGYDCVLFDEFHERSLNADLGLAFALEIHRNLREDLALVVMSATLNAAPIAAFMGAKIFTAEGRSFPVETQYLDKPAGFLKRRDFANAMAALITKAAAETEGDILAFLPGEGEIRTVETQLAHTFQKTHIAPLFGAMPFRDQQAAIRPTDQRKIVLATSIAETSLTIEGITCVVDGGLSRRARFDAGSGMARLVTERVSKAEATQRMGRAGRVQAGYCYRLWAQGEEGAFPAFAPPEIETADLTSFAFELAQWGLRDVADLPMLTYPNAGDLTEARALLRLLGALDDAGGLTDLGQDMVALPTHPRLAAMLRIGGQRAGLIAALLEERDSLPRHAEISLRHRLDALERPKEARYSIPKPVQQRLLQRAKQFKTQGSESDPAILAATAFPDRIGRRRKGKAARYHLSGGKGAIIGDDDALAAEEFIVVIDLDGDAREAKLRLGTPITKAQIEQVFENRIEWTQSCHWSKREGRVEAVEERKLGALTLESRRWKDAPQQAKSAALCEGIRQLGLEALNWDRAAQLFRARVQRGGAEFPDMSNAALLAGLEAWLLPYLQKVETKSDLKTVPLTQALKAMLDWDQIQRLDALVPEAITAPTGTKLKIDYSGDAPKVSVRIQEVFGMTKHPTIGAAKDPLLFELLSPAQRPIQLTTDLPGFWAGSYADLRKDMRSAYPKHYWPEDPSEAEPTKRVKRKK
ncbi:MAG: ATP-dependent helicase HrpB [Pseudomonadota bacterium]